MNTPPEFWSELLPTCTNTNKPAGQRRKYCLNALHLLQEKHPCLYNGEEGATLTENEALAFVELLRKKAPGFIFKHQMSLLIRGLEKGHREKGWQVAIPAPPLVIPRDRPRLTRDDFRALPLAQTIETAFREHLNDGLPQQPEARLGQLLVSAVLYGGLVSERWLKPWLEAVATPCAHEDLLWLDMEFTSGHLAKKMNAMKKKEEEGEKRRALEKECKAKGETPPEKNEDSPRAARTWDNLPIKRRWHADPITQCLILRWHEQFPDDRHLKPLPSPKVAIMAYLRLILPDAGLVKKVDQLLNGAAVRYGLAIAPALLSYAEERIKSVSLPQQTWHRIITGRQVVETDPASSEAALPLLPKIARACPTKTATLQKQEDMLAHVLSEIVPHPHPKKLKGSEVRADLECYVKDHTDELCEILHYLLKWAIDMLTPYDRDKLLKGRKRENLCISTVHTYLATIAKKLIHTCDGRELDLTDSDELHDMYLKVVHKGSTMGVQSDVANRLVNFHEFLTVRCDAEPVDFSDIVIGGNLSETGVCANLLTPEEFDLVKKALAPTLATASRLQKMALLVAILGFRCGMRRGEVRRLLLSDVIGNAQPDLLVQSNCYGKLKTCHALRRFPLALLLEPDELELLVNWRRDRQLEDVREIDNSLMFCIAGSPTDLYLADEPFMLAEQAMRQVTGDSSQRFHLLRHSFANWLLVRLTCDVTPPERQRFRFLDHHLFDHESCAELRRTLLGNNGAGRQAWFAVAQLCGHGSPAITFLHYVHLTDWLVARELAGPACQPELDAPTVANMTTFKQNKVYYIRKAAKAAHRWQLADFRHEIRIPKEFYATCEQADLNAAPLVITRFDGGGAIPLWRRIESLLYDHQVNLYPYSRLAARHGLPPQDVESWCNAALALQRMRTEDGGLRHVNGATVKNNLGEDRTLMFPIPPHSHADQKLAAQILTVYEQAPAALQQRIAAGIDTFIDSFSVSTAMTVASLAEAGKLLELIALLGISEHQVQFIESTPTGSHPDSTSRKADLAREMKLPESAIRVLPPSRTRPTSCSRFTIRVVANGDPRADMKSSYGFRYALYLLKIMASAAEDAQIEDTQPLPLPTGPTPADRAVPVRHDGHDPS